MGLNGIIGYTICESQGLTLSTASLVNQFKLECKLRSKFYSAVSREHSAVLGSNFDCYCFGRKVSDCYTKIIMDMGIMFHQMRGADPALPLAAEKRIIIHYLSKIVENCQNSKLH